MAPSRTPGRKQREADYTNIGVAGRKTGITLKDTGVRDEHGLEPIDGIFSSPERSPLKRNGAVQQSTLSEEEDMDIGQSTIPEPAEVLSVHRSRRSILPPPRARSPIKTHLNSSPRRSVGPRSSPGFPGQDPETPSRSNSHPAVNRQLDFSPEEPQPTIEALSVRKRRSTSTSPKVTSGSGNMLSNARKGKKRPFNLSAEENFGEDGGEDNTSEVAVGALDMPQEDDEPSLDVQEDEPSEEYPSLEPEAFEKEQSPMRSPVSKQRRAKKNVSGKLLGNNITSGIDDESVIYGTSKKQPTVHQQELESADLEAQPRVTQKRGRPKKKDQNGNLDDGSIAERPTKRTKQGTETPSRTIRKGHKLHPSQRDPNAKITSASKGKGPPTESEQSKDGPGRPSRARSLQILRGGTPMEDGGVRILRSGRTSVKPLAYWRNERLVYGDSYMEGGRQILPGIKEILRTEDVDDPRPRARVRSKAGRNKPKTYDLFEEDEDQEEWEVGDGILQCEVQEWDPMLGRAVEESETVEVAHAPTAIQAAMRDVRGAEFQFAKTLTLPFFGTGMVDLPPGGEKRIKNSRKNQMVFFVFYGRVKVNVANAEFSVGRGGMWQVPRGNIYSIANHYKGPARIFFAQGCDTMAENLAGFTDEG